MKKELGLLGVFSIAAGAMISSGLFVLPGIAYKHAGPAVILSYILAGVVMLPAVLAKAELSTAMPKAGGTYFYIERSMGGLAGTMAGFSQWFSVSLKSAFALVGIGALLKLLFPEFSYFHIRITAIAFLALFTVINLASVKISGKVQVLLVLILLFLLVIYSAFGSRYIDVKRYVPFMPYGWKSVFFVSGFVFVSYGGLTKVASMAEEVRNPGRNIPLGMLLAFFVVGFLYVAVVAITVGVLDSHILSGSLTPISDGAKVFLGVYGEIVLSLAALLAFATTANAGILASSRCLMAMSRDGWLPPSLSKVHHKYKTPHLAILVTSVLMGLLIIALDLERLVEVASTMQLLLFVLVCVSLIIMRESKIVTYKPVFKAPLYPWIYALSALVYLFFIAVMGKWTLLITGVFFAFVTIWYWIYPRRGEKRRSALMYIVEKATDTKLKDRTLSQELREILMERDEVVEDRFDHLVKECPILDLEGPLEMEEFFELVARELAPILGMDSGEIKKRLLEREAQSHTVVKPGLAIPHIIIDGEKRFALLIARCRKGVHFRVEEEPVKAIFVMAGTRDERNFHLRALMAIASIAQENDFEKKWEDARDAEEIRHFVLSSGRKRI